MTGWGMVRHHHPSYKSLVDGCRPSSGVSPSGSKGSIFLQTFFVMSLTAISIIMSAIIMRVYWKFIEISSFALIKKLKRTFQKLNSTTTTTALKQRDQRCYWSTKVVWIDDNSNRSLRTLNIGIQSRVIHMYIRKKYVIRYNDPSTSIYTPIVLILYSLKPALLYINRKQLLHNFNIKSFKQQQPKFWIIIWPVHNISCTFTTTRC